MNRLDFNQSYVLENERVKLEPLRKDLYEALYIHAKDSKIWTFFDVECTQSNDFKRYLDEALEAREAHREYPFAIYDKLKNQWSGLTRMYAYDSNLRNIKLGHTWIGTDFQGTGLNKAVKHCILEFAFERLSVERVGFGVHEENIKSINALKGIGAVKEGVLRNFLYSTRRKKRCDLYLFSILKEEWDDGGSMKLIHQVQSYLK